MRTFLKLFSFLYVIVNEISVESNDDGLPAFKRGGG